jgi:hypothetical protein
VVDFPNALWLADFVSESNVISITYVFAVLFWPARHSTSTSADLNSTMARPFPPSVLARADEVIE